MTFARNTGNRSGRFKVAALAAAVTALCSITVPVVAQDEPPRGERPGVRGGQDGERQGRGGSGRFEGRRGRGQDAGGRFGRAGGPRGGQRGGMGRGGFGGPGGMMEFMQPELLRRDLRIISNELDLDDDQDAVLETLLLDYDAAFDDASEAIREKFTELRPRREEENEETRTKRDAIRKEIGAIREEFRSLRRTEDGGEPDPAAMEAARAKMESIRERMRALRPPRPEGAELEALVQNMSGLASEWQQTRDRLRTEFMTNLRAILSDEQSATWPTFEMTFRRQKTIDQGELSGESVDLIALTKQLDLDDDQLWQIRPALDAYALSVDLALAARQKHLSTSRLDMMQAMMSRDMEVVTKVVENEMKMRTAVRDVNLQHAAMITAQLAADVDETVAREFGETWRERAYRRIWRTGTTQRSFEIARDFEDIDEDTLEAIVSLEGSYLIELYAVNERLEQVTRESEPEQRVARMRWVSERMRDGNWMNREGRPEDPLREAFDERSDLDRRHREMLEAILTPEQIEQLPRMRRERGERRGGWGQREERGDRGDDAERRQRMLERFDADGDGELSDEERQNAREQRRGGRGGPNQGGPNQGGGNRGGGNGGGNRGGDPA